MICTLWELHNIHKNPSSRLLCNQEVQGLLLNQSVLTASAQVLSGSIHVFTDLVSTSAQYLRMKPQSKYLFVSSWGSCTPEGFREEWNLLSSSTFSAPLWWLFSLLKENCSILENPVPILILHAKTSPRSSKQIIWMYASNTSYHNLSRHH